MKKFIGSENEASQGHWKESRFKKRVVAREAMRMTQEFTRFRGVAMQGQGADEGLFSKSFRPAMNAVRTSFLGLFPVSGQETTADVKPVTMKVEVMA